jgi:hypothetical protein
MGSRGGFDNGMAGGCTPVRGVDAFDVKIKLRADPSLLPMHARTSWRRFHEGVIPPSAYHRLAPPYRGTL